MKTDEKAVVFTYPRSGLNFLVDTYNQQTKHHLHSTHFESEVNGREVLSIVRDPKSTIASILVMDINNGGLSLDDPKFDQHVGNRINEYIQAMRYIRKFGRVVVFYKDLCQDPGGVVQKLAKYLDDEILYPEALAQGVYAEGHLTSSRSLSYHQDVVDRLKDFRWGQALVEYNILLAEHKILERAAPLPSLDEFISDAND